MYLNLSTIDIKLITNIVFPDSINKSLPYYNF